MDIVNMHPDHLADLQGLAAELRLHPIDTPRALRFGTLEDGTSPPELRLLAIDGGDVVGFCLACLREDAGVIKLFGVAPQHRRRGIASALFDEAEARLAARGARRLAVEGAAPHWFFPGVEVTRTAAVSFLLARGYETDRVARVDMRVDLRGADLDASQAVAALGREGIVMRRALPRDVDPTVELIAAHFSRAWQVEAHDATLFDPTPLYVALDGEGVVGFAAYDVSGPCRFGPTGTHPDYRRRGIGGALLKMCLRDMRDRGDDACEICWVGPIGYYARAVGAEIHRAYWCFRKQVA